MTTNTQGIGGDSLSNEEAYTVASPLDNPVPVPTIQTQANIVEPEFIKNPVINLDGVDDYWYLNDLYKHLATDWTIEFKFGTLTNEPFPYTMFLDQSPGAFPAGYERTFVYVQDSSSRLSVDDTVSRDLWLNDVPTKSGFVIPQDGREVKLKVRLISDKAYFNLLGRRYTELAYLQTYMCDFKVYDPQGVLRYDFSLRRQDMDGNQQKCPISGHVIKLVNGEGSADMKQQEPKRTGKGYLFSGVDEYVPIRPRRIRGDFEFTIEYRKTAELTTNVALIGGLNTSSNSGAFAVYLRSDNEYIQAQVPVEGGGFQYISVPCQLVGQDGVVTIKRVNGVVSINNGNVTGTIKYVGNSDIEVGCIAGWRRTLMPMLGYIHKVDLGGGDVYDFTKNTDKAIIEHETRADGPEILGHPGRQHYESDRTWRQLIIGDPNVPEVEYITNNLFRLKVRNFGDKAIRYSLYDVFSVIQPDADYEIILAPRSLASKRNYVSTMSTGAKGFGYFTVHETWAAPIINYNPDSWRNL